MNINQEQLDQYRQMYKKRFNREISEKRALKQAIKLLLLVKAIYQAPDINNWRERR